MNDLQIFKNEAFGQIRIIEQNQEPWFVAKDVCDCLEIKNSRDALSRLDDDEKNTVVLTDGNRGNPEKAIVNEFGLYNLVLTSRKKEAKQFKRWVTHEVLPSIRKTGGYLGNTDQLSDAEIMAKALVVAQKTIAESHTKVLQLEGEVAKQQQIIHEHKPKIDYVDQILQSTDVVTTTQIAKDYGLTANKLNKILHEEKVQYKLGGQWLLYQQHAKKGLTKSETISVQHKSGRESFKMITKWTQKGRLFIHNLLDQREIDATA